MCAGSSGRGDNLGYSAREPPEPLVAVLEGGLGDTPPLTFQALPNVMWHYSGGGYYLLQLLVADLTGASFEDDANEFVLGPLRDVLDHVRGTTTATLPSSRGRRPYRWPLSYCRHPEGSCRSCAGMWSA